MMTADEPEKKDLSTQIEPGTDLRLNVRCNEYFCAEDGVCEICIAVSTNQTDKS